MANRSKGKVQLGDRKHSTYQTISKQQEEQASKGRSLRRSSRLQTAQSSTQKIASRKRPRETEVGKASSPRCVDIFLSRGRNRTQPEKRTSPPTEHPSKRRELLGLASRLSPKRQLKRHQEEQEEEGQPRSAAQKFKRRRISPSPLDAAEEKSSYVSDWVEKLPNSFLADMAPQHRLAEKKSSASLRRKRLGSSSSATSASPSDQRSRDGKSATYAHKGFQMLLKVAGVLLESELPVSDESEIFCQNLLKTECHIPEDTLLSDDSYRETIADLQERNESRVIQDVGRLFVPSAQTLAKRGNDRFRVFVESVNEAWDCCYPLVDPRPQPDYAVGFGRAGLSEARINKLQPLIQDDPTFRSDYTATYYMYFPFFATEVKCGTSGLVIADRQNGHTMGVCVRSILSIYRLAGKETQLQNRPIVFSVAHDHRMVRLTGWGPVIDGESYTVHPLTVHSFDVTPLRGLERWTSRRFTIGVYNYGLTLLHNIKAIIDELPPDLNLGKVQPLKLGLNMETEPCHSNRSGLSQQLDAHILSEDAEGLDSQPSSLHQQESTAPTSPQIGNPPKKVKP